MNEKTLASPVQPSKAFPEILVTELGMVTEVRPVQSLKAPSPILVTNLGMVSEVKPVQPSKTFALISVMQ